MKISELVKLIPDEGIVLIEFPGYGGPYRSPGVCLPSQVNSDDTVIESDYPRRTVPVDQFKEQMLDHNQDGQVQLYMNDPHFGKPAYHSLNQVRLHKRGVVLIAGKVLAT